MLRIGAPPSGPAFGRALVLLCTPTIVCQELHRRLALWLPLAMQRAISVDDLLGFLSVLLAASDRDTLAWLRTAQNSWATRGRFLANYSACLVCGSDEGDRLRHLITCRVFWRPIFLRAPTLDYRGSVRRLFMAPVSPSLPGVGFHAHAALRGLAAPNWPAQVAASS